MIKYTLKTFLICFLIHLLGSCSNIDDRPAPILPTVITTETILTGATVATVGGNITDRGNGLILRGFVWDTLPNPIGNTGGFYSQISGQDGLFSHTITTLKPLTTYYVRAFAESPAGLSFGNPITLTTRANIITDVATNITSNSAKLKGSVFPDSHSQHEVGFVYSTNTNPTIYDRKTSHYISGSGNYELTLYNLTQNTLYYAKAYIKIYGNPTDRYYYGSEIQFRTAQ